MFIRHSLRFNIHAPQTIGGVRYPNFLNPSLRAQLGITEIADPVPPEDYSPDTHYAIEQDDAPYVVYTRKSDEQIAQAMMIKYEAALDGFLDQTAKDWRYNDRFTFALRAGYPGPWQAEGAAFALWMDGVNAQAYQLLQDVQAGTVPMPTVEEFLAMFPPFVYPPEAVQP